MARRRVVGNEPKGDVGEYSTISIENIICNNNREIKDFTKKGETESGQGKSCDSLNSVPHLEGSDKREDSDRTTQENRSFDTPYRDKQMNLIFQAECSRVIDDLARMAGNIEPEHEVRPKLVEQDPGSNETTDAQLKEAKQDFETAETQLEGAKLAIEAAEVQLDKTIQELASAKGMRLSVEMQLKVAFQALRSTVDLVRAEEGKEANAAEEEVDSTTNLHTDHTHHSREKASDPLSMNQPKVPRSMDSGQAELIDNLNQHTTRDELDEGSDEEGFIPISMMVQPCMDTRGISSIGAGEVQLTQFDGSAMPHFYE